MQHSLRVTNGHEQEMLQDTPEFCWFFAEVLSNMFRSSLSCRVRCAWMLALGHHTFRMLTQRLATQRIDETEDIFWSGSRK